MDCRHIGKLIILSGFLIILFGIIFMYFEKWRLFFDKVPIGRLPGDIIFKGKNISFYFPAATCLLISLIMTLLFYFLRRR